MSSSSAWVNHVDIAASAVYRRDHLRALAQRVEVDAKEIRIMGSKSQLLRTLVAAESAKTAGFGVPGFVPKWRATADEDGHYCFAVAL
jgi:site-specific DNA recombinase